MRIRDAVSPAGMLSRRTMWWATVVALISALTNAKICFLSCKLLCGSNSATNAEVRKDVAFRAAVS